MEQGKRRRRKHFLSDPQAKDAASKEKGENQGWKSKRGSARPSTAENVIPFWQPAVEP